MIALPTESEPVVVVCGDCRDVLPVLRQLPKGSIAATITDPPYGIGLGKTNDQRCDSHHLGKRGYTSYDDTYDNFVSIIVPALNGYIDLANRSAVFTGEHIHEQRKPDAIGGIFCPAAIGRSSWGFRQFLPLLLYGIAPDMQNGCFPTVLRSTVSAEKNGHPCPKPLEWMRWVVRLASRKGELIVDPFGGSGTTAVAALHEGRRCLIVEQDPHYCDIIRRRVAEAQSEGLFADVKSEQPSLFGEDPT